MGRNRATIHLFLILRKSLGLKLAVENGFERITMEEAIHCHPVPISRLVGLAASHPVGAFPAGNVWCRTHCCDLRGEKFNCQARRP
jgi:hypothetical protein